MTNGVATSDANNVTPCPPTLHALPRATLEVNPVLLKASISEDYLTSGLSCLQVEDGVRLLRFDEVCLQNRCTLWRNLGSASMRSLSAELISLNLDNSAVAVRVVYEHSNSTGLNTWERKLSPDLIVSTHTAPGYRYPTRAIPILHIERCDPVLTERHRFCRIEVLCVVLESEDIDLVDCLRATEIHLHPIRISIRGRVIPAAAASPVQALAVAIDYRACRIRRTKSRRSRSHASIDGCRNIRRQAPRLRFRDSAITVRIVHQHSDSGRLNV